MKLYHFSDTKIDGKLTVKTFGEHSFTDRDKKICNIKRLYFYNTYKPAEHRFKNTRYCYVINIQDFRIYNLSEDKYNLCEQFNGDINKIVKYIKKNNYYGLLYNIGCDIIAVLRDIKYTRRLNRKWKV